MQDAPHDLMTGEIIEPRAGRGDVLPYGDHMRHFYDAFAELQAALPIEIENDKDSKERSVGKYLTYAGMMKVIRPIAQANKFIIIHGQTRSWSSDDKTRLYVIYTDLIHPPSGMFRRSQIEMPIPKLTPQSVGSAMTYGKRYTLLAILGVATADDVTDDDGAGAMPNRVDEDFLPSDLLIQLRDEVAEIKKASDLGKWADQNAKRLQGLDDTESGMLRQHYANHKRGLLAKECAS